MTHPSEEVILMSLSDIQTLDDAGLVLPHTIQGHSLSDQIAQAHQARYSRPAAPRSLWGVEIGGWPEIIFGAVVLLVLFIGIPFLLWLVGGAA